MSLQEGIVPIEWKETSIIPLLKRLKKQVRNHMVDFLSKFKLIKTSQRGFLTARSCLTNLICFFEETSKWADEGSQQ